MLELLTTAVLLAPPTFCDVRVTRGTSLLGERIRATIIPGCTSGEAHVRLLTPQGGILPREYPNYFTLRVWYPTTLSRSTLSDLTLQRWDGRRWITIKEPS